MEKYTKIRVLGKGSFGSAILIKRRSDNALLVIKEVFLGKMGKREREEARQECRMLQQLNHPNIVRYVEHFENRNNLYIVMEYCDGGDLHVKLKDGPLKESSILYYYSQVCLAMEYLHSRHILHRDIKTMNVFLMKNGSVKLGDFGISTVLRNTMGMANTVCGTPYYFSPEICLNKPYNNKSDVWALGVLLYELATGRHPFNGNSMQQLMQHIVKGKFAALPTHFSPEFRKMVGWCLEKDPARRPSIKQMLSLSVVRCSLEQLEENLMLATQCKVRLKDIMDFEVRSENNGNINHRIVSPTKQQQQQQQQQQHHSPSARSPAMSPGKVAAMAVAGQQGLLLSPRRRPSGAEAVVPPPAQGNQENVALIGPKPKAAGAAVEQVRIDNFRRHLKQQFQRKIEAEKVPPSFSPPVKDNGGVENIVTPPSPAAMMPGVASPRRRPSQQQEAHAAPPPHVDRQNLNNKELHREEAAAVAVGGGNGDPIGFDERMKRIDAIMQRYAQNVDPKARDTIHAYMKHKREEHIRQQKLQHERIKRREEMRQKELAMVKEQQNRICRAETICKLKCKKRQQRVRASLQKQPPLFQLGAPIQSPSSPIKAPPPPPPPAQQQQQRQHQLPGFGRNPRCGGRASRDVVRSVSPPLSSSQRCEHAYNRHDVPNRGRVSPINEKKRVLSANSPHVLGQPKLPRSLEPSPRSDGNLSAPEVLMALGRAERAAVSPVFMDQKAIDNDGNNRRLTPPPPMAGRGGVFLPSKGERCMDAAVQPQKQRQRSPSVPCVANAPVVGAAPTGVAGNVEESNCRNDEKVNQAKEFALPRGAQRALVRRCSPPTLPPVEDAPLSPSSPSGAGLQILGGKQMIRPTAAAGFVPQAVVDRPRSPKAKPLVRVQSHAAVLHRLKTGASPVFLSKEDLPASVKARRRVEQGQRRQVMVSEVKSSLDELLARRGTTPQLQALRNNGESKNNNGALERNLKSDNDKQANGNAPSCLNIGASAGNDNKGDERQRRWDVPQPLSLVPLQPRLAQMLPPHCGSPSFVSSPTRGVAVGSHAPAGRQVGKQQQQQQQQQHHQSRGGGALQPAVGVMPVVFGVKVPPQTRGPSMTGARPESHVVQSMPLDGRPVLVNVDYSVSTAPPDDGVKQAASTESNQMVLLPSISDTGAVAEPPDVAQQWRNVADHNGVHKMPYRPQLHMQNLSKHETLEQSEDTDVIAAFQKAKGGRPNIPSILEALHVVPGGGDDDGVTSKGNSGLSPLAVLKGKQNQNMGRKPSSPKPQSLPSALTAPLCSDHLSSKQVLSPTTVEFPPIVFNSSPEVSRSANMDDGEVASLVPLLSAFFDPHGGDETEHSVTSLFSSDLQHEGSLNGYIAMLDHLKAVLHSRSKGVKSANSNKRQQPPASSGAGGEKALVPSLVTNHTLADASVGLPIPQKLVHTHVTSADHKEPHGQSPRTMASDAKMKKEEGEREEVPDQPSQSDCFEMCEEDYEDSAEEEIDSNDDDDDDDDDFEDALPLSPGPCEKINEKYHCLIKDPQNICGIALGGQDRRSDVFENSDVETCDVEVAHGSAEKIGCNGAGGFEADDSFLTLVGNGG